MKENIQTGNTGISQDKIGTAADNTNGTMNKVRTAVNRIVENSTEQAENSKSTSEHMRLMGDNITETSAEVEALNSNAAFMHESSEKSLIFVTIHALVLHKR